MTKEEQQLNDKIENVNKTIEEYVNWIIAMGEKLEKPEPGLMADTFCFLWELGPNARACMIREGYPHPHPPRIMIGYKNLSSSTILNCCDYIPYTEAQKERVKRLYARWQYWIELENKRKEYDGKNALKNRLQRVIPKETE
jgi:hypothetical protein